MHKNPRTKRGTPIVRRQDGGKWIRENTGISGEQTWSAGYLANVPIYQVEKLFFLARDSCLVSQTIIRTVLGMWLQEETILEYFANLETFFNPLKHVAFPCYITAIQ